MSTSAFPGLQPIHIKLTSIPADGDGPENLWELAKTQEGGAGGKLEGITDRQVEAAILRKNYADGSGARVSREEMIVFDSTGTAEVFAVPSNEDYDLPLPGDVHGTFFEMAAAAVTTIAAVTFYVDVWNE